MKTLGERDNAAQEAIHHLLSLKLHSSSFNAIPVSPNGSRRVHTNPSVDSGVLAVQPTHSYMFMLAGSSTTAHHR